MVQYKSELLWVDLFGGSVISLFLLILITFIYFRYVDCDFFAAIFLAPTFGRFDFLDKSIARFVPAEAKGRL